MNPSEVSLHIGGMVTVNNPKIGGRMLFTAYIFRIKNGKKIYQAEVQNPDPPHEIYIVLLDDVTNT